MLFQSNLVEEIGKQGYLLYVPGAKQKRRKIPTHFRHNLFYIPYLATLTSFNLKTRSKIDM